MTIRLRALPFVLSALVSVWAAGASQAVIPTRGPDVEGTISKVTPPTAAEAGAGVLATVAVKDNTGRVIQVQVTKATDLHQQDGKRVPLAATTDLKAGREVSVWKVTDKPEKAQAILIFP